MTRRAAALAACLGALVAAGACSRTKQVRPAEEGEREAPRGRGSGAGIPPEPGRPRVPAAPQALLADGTVTRLQQALARRGLLGAHREGELDAPTSAAIRRLQHEKGLAATGFPDRETLKDLGIDPERAYVGVEDRRRAEGQGGEGGGDRGR